MSSYISVGIVANDKEDIFMKKCVQIIKKNSMYIIRLVIKYPDDDTCTNWNECNESIGSLNKIIEICYRNEFAEIIADYKINAHVIKGVIVKIKKEKGKYAGILFEIPEDNFDLENEIDDLEDKIITEMKELLNLGFEYAYCDNETDIEYSVEEILEGKEIYSILVVKENETITSKLGSWKIDGLTDR